MSSTPKAKLTSMARHKTVRYMMAVFLLTTRGERWMKPSSYTGPPAKDNPNAAPAVPRCSWNKKTPKMEPPPREQSVQISCTPLSREETGHAGRELSEIVPPQPVQASSLSVPHTGSDRRTRVRRRCDRTSPYMPTRGARFTARTDPAPQSTAFTSSIPTSPPDTD